MTKGIAVTKRRGIDDYVPFTASVVDKLVTIGDWSILYLPFSAFAPYVVAQHFDPVCCTWAGGYFFRTCDEAIKFIDRLV